MRDPRDNKIIGGMFGLETLPPAAAGSGPVPAFLAGSHLRLATARSAFRLLAEHLSPATVWLPSYLCGVISRALPAGGPQVRFYAMDERLQVADPGWLVQVARGDLVVFIDYFGFNHWAEHGAAARQRGAWVVEDACQALLNETFCEHSHYVIVSPRKFVGVPDGGILLAAGGSVLPTLELPSPPADWWQEALAAAQQRAEFDRHGGDRGWFELFRKFDPAGPMTPTRMSELTSVLLARAVDYATVARRRRENYRWLAAALPELALFPELPAEVVPLGFPVRVRARDRVRQVLFDAAIYPPVHWPLHGVVPPEFSSSHRLAGELMTLPCDQRCDEDDLRRISKLLTRGLARV